MPFAYRSHIELAIAIFAACLAALRPLARAAVAGVASAKAGNNGSSKQYFPVDGSPQHPPHAVELRDRDATTGRPRFSDHNDGSQERIVKNTEINIDFAPARAPFVAEGRNLECRV